MKRSSGNGVGCGQARGALRVLAASRRVSGWLPAAAPSRHRQPAREHVIGYVIQLRARRCSLAVEELRVSYPGGAGLGIGRSRRGATGTRPRVSLMRVRLAAVTTLAITSRT